MNKISKSKHPVTVLQVKGICKKYGSFKALNNVDFDLVKGEVHALFGENGAGKSTLISIISGAIKQTTGQIFFKGESINISSVKHARNLGISAVFQEFSLVPQMTVAENLFLGEEPTNKGFIDKKEFVKKSTEVIDRLGFTLDCNKKVASLSRAEQQMVEIAKAFRSKVSVLILDEPTASLTEHETKQLFKIMNNLTKKGVGIIYITHKMAEIKQMSDRVSIMRDGKYIGTLINKNISEAKIIELITGKKHGKIYPRLGKQKQKVVFEALDVTTNNKKVKSSSVRVHEGEIVGLAGLVGSGKSEFGQACYEFDAIQDGAVIMEGQDITNFSIINKIKAGLIYLPSDRKNDGLMLVRQARENINLVFQASNKRLFINKNKERQKSNEVAKTLKLYPNDICMLAEQFSGGNQQKIMLSRILARDFKVVILDEPTVGVDVGARAVIYELVSNLVSQGLSIILISSDLPEVLNLSHRVYVFNKGKIKGELVGKNITEQNVLSNFF